MANVTLLRETLQHIKDNQEGWQQKYWRSIPGLRSGNPRLAPTMCGTAMCFAGETVQLVNPKDWVVQTPDIKKAIEAKSLTMLAAMDPLLPYVVAKPNEDELHGALLMLHPVTKEQVKVIGCSVRATEYLGISPLDAGKLFEATNTLEMLEDMVEMLCTRGSLRDYEMPLMDEDDDDD